MDRFFGLDHTTGGEGLSLLATLHDDTLVRLYEALLLEEGIPCLKKDRGAGGAVRLIMGNTLYGTDLYVPTELLERAKELITPTENIDSEENEASE